MRVKDEGRLVSKILPVLNIGTKNTYIKTFLFLIMNQEGLEVFESQTLLDKLSP